MSLEQLLFVWFIIMVVVTVTAAWAWGIFVLFAKFMPMCS